MPEPGAEPYPDRTQPDRDQNRCADHAEGDSHRAGVFQDAADAGQAETRVAEVDERHRGGHRHSDPEVAADD
jgi:hypothetical protein